jgi:predicted dehydrogenase
MKQIGVALIGLGNMGRAHERGYLEAPERARIVAACDVRSEVATERAAALHCTAYTDYLALLQDPAVDAVDITLPHNLHYTVARAALDRGKHVLIEKPMAGTSEECRDLIDTANRNDLTFTVAENTRFVTAYIEAEKLIKSGEFGEPRMIRTFIYGSAYQDLVSGAWISKQDISLGGVIIDNAPHSFYLLKWLFGEIEAVQAFQNRLVKVSETEDHALVNGIMKNGALFSNEFTATAEIPWGERCEIYGSKGSLIIDQLSNPPAVHYRGAQDFTGVPLANVPCDLHGWKRYSIAETVKDFVDAALDRRPPMIDAYDGGYYALKIVEKAYESVANSGKLITV